MQKMHVERVGRHGPYTSFVVRRGGDVSSCQDFIDREIDEPSYEWLQLKHVLQNIKGKGIASIMGAIVPNGTNVLVKVQKAVGARREYEVQQTIRDIDGIIPYTCYVTCNGNAEYIETYGPPLPPYQKLCKARGTSLGIIIMPYFPLGSLETYLREAHQSEKKALAVKLILCKAIYTLYKAYSLHGFVHGDFFSKNVVLKDDYKTPVLIDFENSSIGSRDKLNQFWRDVDCMLGDVARYIFRDALNSIAHEHVIIPRAYGKEPTSQMIAHLCKALHNMTS